MLVPYAMRCVTLVPIHTHTHEAWWVAYGRITIVVSVFVNKQFRLVVWWMRCRGFCFTFVFTQNRHADVFVRAVNTSVSKSLMCAAHSSIRIQNSFPFSLRRTPINCYRLSCKQDHNVRCSLLNGAIRLRWLVLVQRFTFHASLK